MIDRMYFTVAVGDNAEKALDYSTFYPNEESAERFVASWNANEKTVANHGKARVISVRVMELIDTENDPAAENLLREIFEAPATYNDIPPLN